MANIDEIKKIASEEGVELTEDVLEAIAGGAYTYEEWTKFSDAERDRLRQESSANRKKGLPCVLD